MVPTHECQSCLATTIQGSVVADPGMVLPNSACAPRPGLGHLWNRIAAARTDPAPVPNEMEIVTALLKKSFINPDIQVLMQLAKSPQMLNLACRDADSAYQVYNDFKNLPKSFTCGLVEKALNINVNGPPFGDAKPFILGATDQMGVQMMVKLLRIDPDSPFSRAVKMAEVQMEIEACRELELAQPSERAFIEASIIEVNIPREHAHSAGVSPGSISALLMPKYAGTVASSARLFPESLAREGRRVFDALKYMHNKNLVHMDIKGDNIFIDSKGKWYIGDFGSCKRIGDAVTSTTRIFYFENLVNKPALPAYDFFMMLVVVLIELLPNKHKFSDYFHVKGSEFISRDKVVEKARCVMSDEPLLSSLVDDLLKILPKNMLDNNAVPDVSLKSLGG